MIDLSPLPLALLLLAGVAAGFINTLAGGGSLLTLPALALAGLPWDIANGTNRVAVLVQSASAARAFHAHGRLDLRDALPLLIPALAGALGGASLAAYIPPKLLEPLIVGLLIAVGLLMALRPKLVLPPRGAQPLSLSERPSARLWVFATGLYGGFLQAGVGYFLLAVLGGALRYDLVRGNAIKVLLIASFTTVALTVFALGGLVDWLAGGLLALASAAGSLLAVKFALRVDPSALRWIILAAISVSCAAVLLR